MNILLTLPPHQRSSGLRKAASFRIWCGGLFYIFSNLFTPLEIAGAYCCAKWGLRKYSLQFLDIGVGACICVLFLTGFLAVSPAPLFAASEGVDVTASVPGCGDGVIGSGEQCDGSNLGGATCSSRGFSGGTLSCNTNCTFNTSACTTAPSPSPGGGGGVSIPSPVETRVIFNGRAYPKSIVTLLRDAQVAATTIAGSDSNFEIDLSGIGGGNYIFSLYSEDYQGIRSALLTFPVSITRGATTQISDIFIAPTIEVDKSEVKKGDNLAIFGQSTGGGEITFVVHSPEEIFFKTRADKNGVYLYNFNTASLEYGYHFTKAKAARDGLISSFSKAVGFQVGTKTIRKKITKALKGDFNGDGRVNLVDFSIAAYWYQRLSPPAKVDLNSDGKVNLVDLSIMAYYWTG